MLTLRDLLRDLDVRLVAGEAGVDRAVRWVHISEIVDPTPWLSGGELLLTTGLQLTRAEAQGEYVARLARHQLTGLGLGTGFAHDSVPEPMLRAADELGFPLFEVPYEVPFIAVTEKAFTHLVNEHYAVLQRALSAHERLERIVLSERGLDGVAGALAGLIGGPAIVFDARGEVLARRAARTPLRDAAVFALADEVRERARAGGRRGYAPGGELAGRALALPVPRTPPGAGAAGDGPAPQAWLVAAKDGGPLTEFDRLTLHQAVTIVALELLRRRVVDDTERRLAGDVLSAMVSGELDGVELARRLEPFGLRDRAAAVVLEPPRQLKAAAEDALARALREEAHAGLAAGTGRFSCALLAPAGGGGDDDLFAVAERLRERVSRDVGTALAAGAGRLVPAGELRRAFHEARCALEARALASNGAAGEPPAGLATYHDLGSFQLLLSLQDDEALRLFCDSILAPIEEGEGAYGGELMRSLEAFIECNGQWERAARRLYCHRHTLRYRIRRVEELTGRSLDSARDRIDFWLALRGRELTKGTA
jgi:purine catabolism regulator